MPLVGLTVAFIAFVFADLQGNRITRPATRAGFTLLVLVESGAPAAIKWGVGGAISTLPI